MKAIQRIKEWFTRKWGTFNTWNEKRAERKEAEQRDEVITDIKNSYAVDVRNNTMWIICGSNAVYRAAEGETVESVITKMNSLIEVNLSYKELK